MGMPKLLHEYLHKKSERYMRKARGIPLNEHTPMGVKLSYPLVGKTNKNLSVGITKRAKRRTHTTRMCIKCSTDANTCIGLKLIKHLRVEPT